MAFSWDNLWPMIQAAGLPGIVIALVVLVFVFVAEFTDLLKDGLCQNQIVLDVGQKLTD